MTSDDAMIFSILKFKSFYYDFIRRSGKGKFDCCLTRAMEFRLLGRFTFDAGFNCLLSQDKRNYWLCSHPHDVDNMVTMWLTVVCNFPGFWELNSRKLPRVYFASKLPTFKFLLMYHLLFLECCELPRIAFHQDRGEIKRNKLLLKLLLRTNLNLIFKELRHETLVSDGAWHRVRTDI